MIVYKLVTITDRKEWSKDKYSFMQCRCNEIKITDSYISGDEWSKGRMTERMKRSCKLIKVSGVEDADVLNALHGDNELFAKVLECELPEWEESIEK